MLPATTAHYYHRFALRHGFSDAAMRGHGHALIRVQPIGDVVEGGSPFSYSPTPASFPDGKRDQVLDNTQRAADRELRLEALRKRVTYLAAHVRLRITPGAAVHEALLDVERIRVGLPPVGAGGVAVVLRSIERILARYA